MNDLSLNFPGRAGLYFTVFLTGAAVMIIEILGTRMIAPFYGASLYEDPAKYIELSPDMHFRGLETAVLFEAGAKSLAINMMGAVKAALYAGLPAEFVIYPRSSHNLHIPSLQKESAERNLDWFRFWLQDYEDPDIEKTEQYSRWHKMHLASENRTERQGRESIKNEAACRTMCGTLGLTYGNWRPLSSSIAGSPVPFVASEILPRSIITFSFSRYEVLPVSRRQG